MSAQLDHLLIPVKNKVAAAERLAQILGVTWARATIGPFAAVYVNDGLTIDFDEWTEPYSNGHYCFRVSEEEFEGILGRLRGLNIAYRSLPHGPADYQVNTSVGGKVVYWNEPGDHVWEALTQSYARSRTTASEGQSA